MPVVDPVEPFYVSAPLPAPFSPAWVPGPPRGVIHFYLVRIATDEGVEGWSAFPAAGHERAGIGDGVANLFLGQDPTDIALVRERIGIMAVQGVRNGWLEPAFWDVKGKLAGVQVYELLGGKAEPVTLYASSGEVKLLASGFANEQPFEYPLSPPGWTIEARDVVLTEPWRHDRGVLHPPTTPGLGFDIDRAALARFGRCFFRADRVRRHWMPEVLKD